MSNKKLYVFTGYIYTDGDWYFNRDMFKNYKSSYFENDLYEYTFEEDYSIRFKRVFYDYDKAVEFVTVLKESIGGRDTWRYEDIVSGIEGMIQDFWKHNYAYFDYDGNSEVNLFLEEFETNAKKIKEIIYED
ncbi:MAG: hypothetical protein J6V44_13130 [Methanobrevibacter sp.]|nr:hypothetical protein [Methanobrevibacter sp.]